MDHDERCFGIATRNRLLAADMLDGLPDDQWRVPSLCAGWTIREVAAHLIPHTNVSAIRLAGELIRHRGDFDRWADQTARKRAREPVDEICRALRAGAAVSMRPVGIGAAGPMTDTVIHLRDMAVPLGLSVTPDTESWRAALDFLVSGPARRGFVRRGLLRGLRLEATDSAWSWGSGPEVVAGPMEALAMSIAGRERYLAQLTGGAALR